VPPAGGKESEEATERPLPLSFRKALEVGKRGGYQVLLARILRGERGAKRFELIAGLFGSLAPIRRGQRK